MNDLTIEAGVIDVVEGSVLEVGVEIVNNSGEYTTDYVELTIDDVVIEQHEIHIEPHNSESLTILLDTEGYSGREIITARTSYSSDHVVVIIGAPDAEPWQDNRWVYSNGSGTVVEDSVGDYDSQFSDITWVNGDSGVNNIYGEVNGVDEWGDLGEDSKGDQFSVLVNNGYGSFGCWIKPNFSEFSDNRVLLFGTDIYSSDRRSFYIGIDTRDGDNTSQIMVSTTDDGNDVIHIDGSEGLIDNGEWQSLAFTANGSTATLVHNGEEDKSDEIEITESGDLGYNVKFFSRSDPPNNLYAGGVSLSWWSRGGVSIDSISEWHDKTKIFFQ